MPQDSPGQTFPPFENQDHVTCQAHGCNEPTESDIKLSWQVPTGTLVPDIEGKIMRYSVGDRVQLCLTDIAEIEVPMEEEKASKSPGPDDNDQDRDRL